MTAAPVVFCAAFVLGVRPGLEALACSPRATTLQAPQTPTFSGSWVLVSPAAAARQPSPSRGVADEIVVTQDGISLTVTHPATLGSYPQPGVHHVGSSGSTGSSGWQ